MSKSLEKNVKRIVKAFESRGFTNILVQRGMTWLDEKYTRVYADLRRDLSVTMFAGGEGEKVAWGAQVYWGAGDFPSVYWAEIRSGKPEVILDKVLERYG